MVPTPRLLPSPPMPIPVRLSKSASMVQKPDRSRQRRAEIGYTGLRLCEVGEHHNIISVQMCRCQGYLEPGQAAEDCCPIPHSIVLISRNPWSDFALKRPICARVHSLGGCSRNTTLCATREAIRDEGYICNVTPLISHNYQKGVRLYCVPVSSVFQD